MRHVANGTSVVLGAALVVPAGVMNNLPMYSPDDDDDDDDDDGLVEMPSLRADRLPLGKVPAEFLRPDLTVWRETVTPQAS